MYLHVTLQQSAAAFLFGDPNYRRTSYVLAVAALAVVAALAPTGLVGRFVWAAGGVAVLLAAVAGFGRFGLVSGLTGTAMYVSAVGSTAFLLSSSGEYPLIDRIFRLSLVLIAATLAVAVPSYLVGAGLRVVVERHG